MGIKRYNTVAVIIHWIMAILLICMFILGIYMVDLPKGSDERSWFFELHKSIKINKFLIWNPYLLIKDREKFGLTAKPLTGLKLKYTS